MWAKLLGFQPEYWDEKRIKCSHVLLWENGIVRHWMGNKLFYFFMELHLLWYLRLNKLWGWFSCLERSSKLLTLLFKKIDFGCLEFSGSRILWKLWPGIISELWIPGTIFSVLIISSLFIYLPGALLFLWGQLDLQDPKRQAKKKRQFSVYLNLVKIICVTF